jgi:hypothetical protein
MYGYQLEVLSHLFYARNRVSLFFSVRPKVGFCLIFSMRIIEALSFFCVPEGGPSLISTKVCTGYQLEVLSHLSLRIIESLSFFCVAEEGLYLCLQKYVLGYQLEVLSYLFYAHNRVSLFFSVRPKEVCLLQYI